MPASVVNISFKNDLLFQIDQIAVNEARTRSELIREAVRLYISRKNEFGRLFKIGKQIGSTLDISEDDVVGEIRKSRRARV